MVTATPARTNRPSAVARSNNLVTVEVGAAKKKYHVHRPLLEAHSKYFKKALNGPWKEAQEGVVKLHDVDCKTFDIFVDWLYSQKLPASSKEWASGMDRSMFHGKAQLAMTKAYVLGDRLDAVGFNTAVWEILRVKLLGENDTPRFEAIIFAFDNLPSDDALLQLLVVAHCYNYSPMQDRDQDRDGCWARRNQLPYDFLLRVMVRYSIDGPLRHKDMDPCEFHNHGPNVTKKCEREFKKLVYPSDSDYSSEEEDDSL